MANICSLPPGHSATISQECITAYNDLKLNKKYKYIVYKLSDDNKEIVVEEASEDADWENFREKLINAKSKSKSVCCSFSRAVTLAGCAFAPLRLAASWCPRQRSDTFCRAPSARARDMPSTISSTAWPRARVSATR